MALKKLNAVFSLLTVLCFLLHTGYSAYAYYTLDYNPSLSELFSILMMVPVCIHMVFGMLTVFLLSDGTRMNLYPKENRRTIIQRVTAALIIPLLFLHMKVYQYMSSCAEKGQVPVIYLLFAAEVLFFVIIYVHISLSFSRALITLGILSSRKVQTVIDRASYIACGCLCFAVCICVIKGQIAMFL